MVYFNDKYDASLAANCEACGQEYLCSELRPVKIANMSRKLLLCQICVKRDASEDFSAAVKELNKLFNDK